MIENNDLEVRRSLLRGMGGLGLSLTAIGLPGPSDGASPNPAGTRADARELSAMKEFVIWRRLDRPGHDAALLNSTKDGWLLSGSAVFTHQDGPACIQYSVAVDHLWKGHKGTVQGFMAGKTFSHVITRVSDGWHLNDRLIEGLKHLQDIDYGFTPATNVLQLRRLAIPLGRTMELPVVWFDADATTLIELPQRYERLTETRYRYSAPTVQYHGEIELLNRNGFVKSYPHLWEIEAST